MEEFEKNSVRDLEVGFDSARQEACSAEEGRRVEQSIVRTEIDTSAPFESVREAASRFGGLGFWKPSNSHKSSHPSENGIESLDVAKVEQQASQLEKELIIKERETLEVLKELEATKTIVQELKSKLHEEASETNGAQDANQFDDQIVSQVEVLGKENDESQQDQVSGFDPWPSSAPGFILLELKQAKMNLNRTTTDLADIRATVETFNRKIEKERISLEKTRQRLSSNTSKISSLKEEINQTNEKLLLAKDPQVNSESDRSLNVIKELQWLNSETEKFKKIREAANLEVMRTTFEIEQTNNRVKTNEIRLVAAQKMKEAAKASEALALSEMKSLSRSENLTKNFLEGVTLSLGEYSSLTLKALEAEKALKTKVMEAMLKVDEAEVSKAKNLKWVEEATEELKNSKKVLEEALSKVEVANKGKLVVEEALRKWRSEHSQKRRSTHNSTKFKNSYPSQLKNSSRHLDLNAVNLVKNDPVPVLKPTLSIGQILSRKLLLTQEFEDAVKGEKSFGKRNVSLGQMLRKSNGDTCSKVGEKESGPKQLPAKRKKFGLSRISFFVSKPSKKKKKHAVGLRLSCGSIGG